MKENARSTVEEDTFWALPLLHKIPGDHWELKNNCITILDQICYHAEELHDFQFLRGVSLVQC